MNRIVRPAGALLALATVTALAACAPDPDVDVVAASALDSASCEAEEGAPSRMPPSVRCVLSGKVA